MQLAIPSIKIDPEIEGLFKLLEGWDYEFLKSDIAENGVKIPIAVAKDGTLLDGHNRLKIWKELGRDSSTIPIQVFPCKTREEKRAEAIKLNILRRHLKKGQRAYFAVKELLPKERIEARERRKSTLKKGQELPVRLISDEREGRAYENAAKPVGLGKDILRKAEVIFVDGSKELVKKVLQDKTSINYAYKMVKREKESKEFPEMPEDVFSVIYADPPWRYNLPFAGSPDAHYVTLPTDKICRLEVPAHENAILFLWVTNPLLPDGLKVMQSWGFTYKTNIVWVKNRSGTGYYVRGQHELLLIGVKGKIGTPAEKNRGVSVVHAPKGKHSEKPAIFYEIIERMYPNQKYLELFARKTRDGWMSWGVEVEN